MNYDLTSAITSIIDAKGENIVDDTASFIKIFENSTKNLTEYIEPLKLTLDSGALNIIIGAIHDDEIGQNNAAKIAINIVSAENNINEEMAIDIITSFCVAFGYGFGKQKTDKQLLSDVQFHISQNEMENAIEILCVLDSKNNSDAQYMLGYLYYMGKGVEKSYTKAKKFLEKSIKGENPLAYFLLGNMYLNGMGVDKSTDKCLELWENAAALGYVQAEYNLYMLYSKGLNDVPVDYNKAFKHIKSAAQKGFDPAIKELGKFSEKEELSDDVVMTLTEMADKGDAKSQYTLGNLYFKGNGVVQSKEKAIKYYEMSAKQGYLASQIVLINRFLLDPSIPVCWTVAKHWYDKAMKVDKKKVSVFHPKIVKGNELYAKTPKTAKNKREKYEEAGELGFITAFTEIGKMYKSNEKAIPYLEKAAESGDKEAIEMLISVDEKYKDKYGVKLDYINNILDRIKAD